MSIENHDYTAAEQIAALLPEDRISALVSDGAAESHDRAGHWRFDCSDGSVLVERQGGAPVTRPMHRKTPRVSFAFYALPSTLDGLGEGFARLGKFAALCSRRAPSRAPVGAPFATVGRRVLERAPVEAGGWIVRVYYVSQGDELLCMDGAPTTAQAARNVEKGCAVALETYRVGNAPPARPGARLVVNPSLCPPARVERAEVAPVEVAVVVEADAAPWGHESHGPIARMASRGHSLRRIMDVLNLAGIAAPCGAWTEGAVRAQLATIRTGGTP